MATPAANKPTLAAKEKKQPVPAAKRISDQLKRAAVTNKITKEELEGVETLAKSLAVFVS
jgi:hypothetical protein